MSQRLCVSRFVVDTYFELDDALVVFHPFIGKTYKLVGVSMEIFKCLLSTHLTAKKLIKSVSLHSRSFDRVQIHSTLQELRALELIQIYKT